MLQKSFYQFSSFGERPDTTECCREPEAPGPVAIQMEGWKLYDDPLEETIAGARFLAE